MREWVLSMSSGRMVLQLPVELNADDVEDIKKLFEIIERFISRTAHKEPVQAGEGSET